VPIRHQEGACQDHAAEGHDEDEEAGHLMEETGKCQGADGDFRTHRDGAEGEHHDARHISRDGERDGAGEEEPLLPERFYREIRVECGDHGEGEQGSDSAAGVRDIHGKCGSGGQVDQGVGGRENRGALLDGLNSDQIQEDDACIRHNETQAEGEHALQKEKRKSEKQKRPGEGKLPHPFPAKQPDDQAGEDDGNGQDSGEKVVCPVSSPIHKKAEDGWKDPKPMPFCR